MKVLLASHFTVPRHLGGVEVHTHRLARHLTACGVDVVVVAADDRRRLGSLHPSIYDGVRRVLIGNPRRVADPRDSLDHPRLGDAFDLLVERERPDLVHFHHLMHLGFSSLERTVDRGIPALLTLHEYWLLCARGGQMIQGSGTLCASADAAVCARCLQDHRFGRSPMEVALLRATQPLERLFGVRMLPLLKRWRPARSSRRDWPEDRIGAMLEFLRERRARVQRLAHKCSRVLAPSAFLRQRFLEDGWPAELVRVWRNGVPDPGIPRDRTVGEPLVVGFLGSLVPVKGVHVLLDAVRRLGATGLTVRIHGDPASEPGYVDSWRDDLPPGVELMGRFHPEDLSSVLRNLDVLVVPSLWYENAPLVISEAFAHGIPVVASDLGGMSEAVRHDADGLLFPAGDAAALARCLKRLETEPQLLERLRCGIQRPRGLAEEAKDLIDLYEEVLEDRP